MGGLLVPGSDPVVVASKNPAKVVAAAAAVQRCFPRPRAHLLPRAVNRIHSINKLRQDWPGDALFVSTEGGLLQRSADDLHCFAWAAVKQASAAGDAISTARSAEFLLPRQLSELVLQQGMELGAADDMLFGRVDSGRGNGTVGHLTHNAVTRAAYYEQVIVMALIPFMNPELCPDFYLGGGSLCSFLLE